MSATKSDCNASQEVLYMAMELSASKWVLGFSTGPARDPRIREIFARDMRGLKREIRLALKRFGLSERTPVVSCYEAGRDGFWIHRSLRQSGINNIVIDSASIEQNR